MTKNPNWLALPEPACRNMGIALMLYTSSYIIQEQLLAMLALNKSTAAKLLVLWNLPVLLLLTGAFEVGSKVMV